MDPHQLVIAGQVRFALCAVGNHIFNRIRIFRLQLDIGREPRTAQADHTRRLDAVDNFLVGEAGRVFPLRIVRIRGKLPVVADHDAVRQRTANHPALLDPLDRTGAAGMDRRRDKTIRFCKQLAYLHLIILLYHRFGRFADVLTERENHFSLRIEETQTAFPAQFLVPFGMYTAAKCIFHCWTTPFTLYLWSLCSF